MAHRVGRPNGTANVTFAVCRPRDPNLDQQDVWSWLILSTASDDAAPQHAVTFKAQKHAHPLGGGRNRHGYPAR